MINIHARICVYLSTLLHTVGIKISEYFILQNEPLSSWITVSTICRGLCALNIVAAFRGMHVSPAKHSYVWLPRKCDYRTDRRTDTGQSDPYVPLCFAGTTKTQLFHTTLLEYLDINMICGKYIITILEIKILLPKDFMESSGISTKYVRKIL